MDYEKLYKEAFSLAKVKYEDASEASKKMLLAFFPGLAESEDEKIRKWIIEELKDSLHDIEAMYSGDYDNRDEQDKDRQAYLNKAIALLEKKKEQKPIEWSYPYGKNETVDRLVSN